MPDVTAPFGFPYPKDTDLVRDGAADIEALAEGVNDQLALGFVYVGTRYYTSSGTFVKADPFADSSFDGAKLRAIRVRVQAAGGGGGGSAGTGAGQNACGGGGGGGAFAESFITNIAGLTTSVTVTRGGGGAGGTAGANAGSAGGASSFGSGEAFEVSASGGGAGGAGPVQTPIATFPYVFTAAGGLSATGDLTILGRGGTSVTAVVSAAAGISAPGADSLFGRGGFAQFTGSAAAGDSGTAGAGGGGGATAAGNAAQAGGAGGNGIVIVDVFA